MSATVVKESLFRRPFQPFRIHLSSGETFDVRHPENAVLVKSGICLANPDEKGALPELPVWCGFLHIAAVEPLAPAASGDNGAGRNFA